MLLDGPDERVREERVVDEAITQQLQRGRNYRLGSHSTGLHIERLHGLKRVPTRECCSALAVVARSCGVDVAKRLDRMLPRLRLRVYPAAPQP